MKVYEIAKLRQRVAAENGPVIVKSRVDRAPLVKQFLLTHPGATAYELTSVAFGRTDTDSLQRMASLLHGYKRSGWVEAKSLDGKLRYALAHTDTCPDCHKTFTGRKALAMHRMRVHTAIGQAQSNASVKVKQATPEPVSRVVYQAPKDALIATVRGLAKEYLWETGSNRESLVEFVAWLEHREVK